LTIHTGHQQHFAFNVNTLILFYVGYFLVDLWAGGVIITDIPTGKEAAHAAP
jgi:hypothetical protein